MDFFSSFMLLVFFGGDWGNSGFQDSGLKIKRFDIQKLLWGHNFYMIVSNRIVF